MRPLRADAPGPARLAHYVLSQCDDETQRRALAGQVNDRRIRAALAHLHAAGRIPFVPSRSEMARGVSYLNRNDNS